MSTLFNRFSALLCALLALTATASPTPAGTPVPTAIAPDQLGAAADRQGAAAAGTLTPTATGA